MLSPALGATLLYFGQGVAVVLVVVHILVRVMGRAEAGVPGAARSTDHTRALARVLDWALTCVLILMASGCVLTAIGLAWDISRYLFKA
jgi:hypothetical protein